MKITGAIFDMDGTLLNSMDYWGMVADEYLNTVGIIPKESTCKRFLEDGMKNWYEYCQREYNLTADYDMAKQGIYELINVKYDTVVKMKDGVRELLDSLYNKGVKMCLATATDRGSVERILKRLDMEKYFSRILTSGEVGKGKREPLIYQLALDYLGTDKETTYVFEDAYYAINTASKAGFNVIGIYDKNVFVPVEEIKPLCVHFIEEGDQYNIDFLLK